MAEVETTVAASAVAEPVTSEPTPAPPPSDGGEFSSVEAMIAAMTKAGTTAPDAEKSDTPAEEAPKSEEAKPAEAEAAAETPEEKKVEEPETKEEPTPEQAAETAESLRQLIKGSNLPVDKKAEIADAYYQAKAFKETGFTVEQAKQFKELNLTPEAVIERVQQHPTIEDARRDAVLAQNMREFANDYQNSPETAARKLYETSTEMFKPFAAEIIKNAPVIAPDLFVEQQSQGFKTALQRIAEEASRNQNEEVRAFANGILEYVYGSETDQSRRPDQESPLFKENQALKERIAKEEQARNAQLQTARGAFANGLRDQGAQLMRQEVRAWVEKLKPSGLQPELVDQVVDETFNSVARDFLANQTVIADMEAYARGPLTKENFQQALLHVARTTKAYLPQHIKKSLEKWSKYATPASAQAPAAAKAKPKPDVGKVPGTPAAPSSKTLEDEVLDEYGKGGMSELEAIQKYTARRAASAGASR